MVQLHARAHLILRTVGAKSERIYVCVCVLDYIDT